MERGCFLEGLPGLAGQKGRTIQHGPRYETEEGFEVLDKHVEPKTYGHVASAEDA